jgi:hypothetical protein
LTSSEAYTIQIMKDLEWAVAYHMYVVLKKENKRKKTVTKHAFFLLLLFRRWFKVIIIIFSYLMQKVLQT